MENHDQLAVWRGHIEGGKPFLILIGLYQFGRQIDYQKIFSSFRQAAEKNRHEGLILLPVDFPDYANDGHVVNFLQTLIWKEIPVAAKFPSADFSKKFEELVPYVFR